MTDVAGFLLQIGGLTLLAAGFVWLLCLTFPASPAWGTALFCLPPLALPYALARPRRLAGPLAAFLLAGLLEIGGDDFLGIGIGIRAGLPEKPGRPQAEELVPAGFRLEPELFVMRELVLECVLAVVESGHLSFCSSRPAGLA